MFFLNLTFAQFMALFGTVSAVVVALYLLDRSRRRQRVATLRFWVASEKAAEVRHRRRIQQPLSLVLQLLSIALLLLALAQLRWGSQGAASRDHVLLLDTSAWMAARSARGTFMDEARVSARAYVRALPSGDRVMLVRADALATPATAFESNRERLEQAILESEPGATALNLRQALDFASHAQRLQGGRGGEVVFVGAGRIAQEGADAMGRDVPTLRVLPVDHQVENCGLRQVGLRRSVSNPENWDVLATIRNYGSRQRTLPVVAAFGGAVVATRQIVLPPGSEQNVAFEFRTRAAGPLEIRLYGNDALPGDDRAILEVPEQKPLRVAVYSNEPNLLRPLLSANPQVAAVFQSPSEYRQPGGADVLILDRFRPQPPPEANAIWIEPPAQGSPIPVRSIAKDVQLARWRSDQPLASGLRARDVRLESTAVFESAPGDQHVAEIENGPVIVARSGKYKTVVLGFHPGRIALRYELTTPLLFANVLRWMGPDIFRRWDLNAGRVGTVNIALAPDAPAGGVQVLAEDGTALPFSLQGRNLRFFADTPGTVRVLAGDREQVYSLVLPEVTEARWQAPKTARKGIPRSSTADRAYTELWPWLALLGGLGLLAEWLLFGRARLWRPRTAPAKMPGRKLQRLPFLRKASGA
jgi:hypothetical protein